MRLSCKKDFPSPRGSNSRFVVVSTTTTLRAQFGPVAVFSSRQFGFQPRWCRLLPDPLMIMVLLAEFSNDFRVMWEHKPEIVVLLIVGFVVFVLVVVDTRRHRKQNKRHDWHHWRH